MKTIVYNKYLLNITGTKDDGTVVKTHISDYSSEEQSKIINLLEGVIPTYKIDPDYEVMIGCVQMPNINRAIKKERITIDYVNESKKHTIIYIEGIPEGEEGNLNVNIVEMVAGHRATYEECKQIVINKINSL